MTATTVVSLQHSREWALVAPSRAVSSKGTKTVKSSEGQGDRSGQSSVDAGCKNMSRILSPATENHVFGDRHTFLNAAVSLACGSRCVMSRQPPPPFVLSACSHPANRDPPLNDT